MKKTLLIAALLVSGLVAASAQTNTPAPVQLTADQLAKVDNSIQTLLPLVPAKYQGLIAGAILLLTVAGKFGRAVVGWKSGGLWGALKAVFAGGGTAVKLLFLLALPALLLTGCAGQQVIETASGSGFKGTLAVPVPYGGGATLIGASLTVGAWKSATVVQASNSVVSVVQVTDGAQTLSGSVQTNSTAGIIATEHDVNALATTTNATVTVTNGAATLNK